MKYQNLTDAQSTSIDIREDLDAAWNMFGAPAKAIGLTVQSIQISPGTRPCKRSRQNSPGPGFALDKELYGTTAPARFRMGLSGCSHCFDSWM